MDADFAAGLQKEYPSAPVYPAEDKKVKLSAAWLIDQSGCKGLQRGNVATHSKQPLVLINLGNAYGFEVVELAEFIREKVRSKFSVELEPEVNVV